MADVNATPKDSLPGSPKTPTNNVNNVSTPKNKTDENQVLDQRTLNEMSPIRFEHEKYLDATPPWEQTDKEQLNELIKKGKNLSAGEQKTKEKLMTKYHTNILTRQVKLLTTGLNNQKKDLNEFNSDRQLEKRTLEIEIDQLRAALQDKLLRPSATSTPISQQEEISQLEEKLLNRLSDKMNLTTDGKAKTRDELVKGVYQKSIEDPQFIPYPCVKGRNQIAKIPSAADKRFKDLLGGRQVSQDDNNPEITMRDLARLVSEIVEEHDLNGKCALKLMYRGMRGGLKDTLEAMEDTDQPLEDIWYRAQTLGADQRSGSAAMYKLHNLINNPEGKQLRLFIIDVWNAAYESGNNMNKQQRWMFANNQAMHALMMTVENCISPVVRHQIDTDKTFMENHLRSGPDPRQMKFFEYTDIVCKHVPDTTMLSVLPEKRMMVSHSRQVAPVAVGSIAQPVPVLPTINVNQQPNSYRQQNNFKQQRGNGSNKGQYRNNRPQNTRQNMNQNAPRAPTPYPNGQRMNNRSDNRGQPPQQRQPNAQRYQRPDKLPIPQEIKGLCFVCADAKHGWKDCKKFPSTRFNFDLKSCQDSKCVGYKGYHVDNHKN